MTESEQVLSRLTTLSNAKNDAELARFLDVSPSTLAMWRTRDTVPYKACVTVSRRENVSLDWLLNGKNSATSMTFSDAMGVFVNQINELEGRVSKLEKDKE